MMIFDIIFVNEITASLFLSNVKEKEKAKTFNTKGKNLKNEKKKKKEEEIYFMI